MIVRIPSPLRSYTEQKSEIDAAGKTVLDVLVELDKKHPGIKFRIIDEQTRIRQHIKIFINTEAVHDLKAAVKPGDTLHLICALSGG